MPIDFPSTPASGQAYTFGTNTWVYNGTYWNAYINKPVISGQLSNNVVYSGNIASGQVGQDHISSGGIRSGAIASGQIGRFGFSSGMAEGFLESTMGGRLTLLSGVTVPSADQTAAGTLYYAPHTSDKVALYDGNKWSAYTVGLVSTSLNTLSSGTIQDAFLYYDGASNSVKILLSQWSSITARSPGSAISYQDGVPILSGSNTNRYVGTVLINNANTSEDSEAKRMLWNYNNQVQKMLKKQDSTVSWTYSSTTVRYANGDIANRLDVVCGQPQGICVVGYSNVACAAAANPRLQLGYNTAYPTSSTTTGNQLTVVLRGANANMLNLINNMCCSATWTCAPGFTTFGSFEFTTSGITTTFYGNQNQGIEASWMC